MQAEMCACVRACVCARAQAWRALHSCQLSRSWLRGSWDERDHDRMVDACKTEMYRRRLRDARENRMRSCGLGGDFAFRNLAEATNKQPIHCRPRGAVGLSIRMCICLLLCAISSTHYLVVRT